MAPRSKKFFGNLDPWSADFAAAVIERRDAHQERLRGSKRHDRIKRMWATVFMRTSDGDCDNTQIISGGRRGESLLFSANRLGRLVRDHVTMVVQTKSLPEPMAANSDSESQDQVALAKGIIEHYKREADLEGIKAERAFVAEICGDSYLHVPWDTDLGNEVAVADSERDAGPTVDEDGDAIDTAGQPDGDQDVDDGMDRGPDTKRIVYEGDFRFSVRSPYDVAYERWNTERKRPRWWIVDEPMNRYDLIAQVEEEVTDEDTKKRLLKSISDAESWSKRTNVLGFDVQDDNYDDSIAVSFVYIETCRACPAGRFAKVIDKSSVLYDGPLTEPRAPVFVLTQGNVVFRNEPTTPNHDGLPLADALGYQLSTILSNNANYGMQRMMSPRMANMSHSSLDEGAAIVEYDHVGKDGKEIPMPKAWDMGPGNPELYKFYQLLAEELDLVAAGSPVTRGDPNSTRGDSGSKVAALFAAAQNIGSSFVADVLRSEQELYTFLVDSLKRHATSKRVVSIVGEHNSYQAKEYTGEKLSKITRVVVTQADAMRDTLQGRIAMVDLLQDKTPEQQRQIIAVLRTGIPDPIVDEMEPARILLERENEDLRNPTAPMPIALPNDPHADHWRSHMNQLNTPDVRRDQALVARIRKHCVDHENMLNPMAPGFAGMPALLMTGQKPLPLEEEPGRPNAPPPLNESTGDGEQGGSPKNDKPMPPDHGQAAKNLPRQPNMPTNPVDGQKMQAPGVGQPSAPIPTGPLGPAG